MVDYVRFKYATTVTTLASQVPFAMQNNFIGNFFSLLAIRGVTLVTGWLQQGWNQLSQKLREWTVLVSKLSELEFELRKDIERSRIA